MFITNGVIKYGETRKIADFENKRADVELSFSAPTTSDGSTGAVSPTFIDELQFDAKRRCHAMLGLAPKPEHLVSDALKFQPGDVVQTSDGQKHVCAQPEEQPKPAKVHNRRAPKMPGSSVAEIPEVIHRIDAEIDLATGKVTETIDQAMCATEVVERAREAAMIEAGTVLITDADLLDATSKRQQDVKNPVAIRKLLTDLGVKSPPGRLVELPQDKRQAYLDRLKDIKPLA